MTCTADTAGTSFTYSTEVVTRSTGGSSISRSSGGGGSSFAARVVVPAAPLLSPATTIPVMVSTISGGATVTAGLSTGFTQPLRSGSTGAQVTALQTRLTAEGVYTGPITGYYGVLTTAGVKAFQKKYGITQLGIVGPMTRAQLNK